MFDGQNIQQLVSSAKHSNGVTIAKRCNICKLCGSVFIYANPVIRVLQFWDKVFKVLRPLPNN